MIKIISNFISQRRGERKGRKVIVRILSVFQKNIDIIHRFFMNNVEYHITALRSLRLCALARVFLQTPASLWN